ncbi:hypothetical protein F5Y17DRAFT_205468 [Xylariaceae sp. FL0594]|nr:hypothetical protein F5Y17DRAFT_205468 [Xylariaceae sp. FL0594]
MSSSTPPSTFPKRKPLHERSNSEKNKLQIRLVPYSPPKIADEDTASQSESRASGSRADTSPTLRDFPHPTTSAKGRERRQGSNISPPSSSSSSSTTTAWVRSKGVSDLRLASDSSSAGHPSPPPPALLRSSHGSFIRRINTPPNQQKRDDGQPIRSRPVSRRERIISINSDKTFSLVLKPADPRTSTTSEAPSQSRSYSQNTSVFSSHEGTSYDEPTDDHPSSLFSALPEPSASPSEPSTPVPPPEPKEDSVDSSPWNYRMAGGVRKVPKTPESRNKGKGKEISSAPLPPLPETTAGKSTGAGAPSLGFKTSFSTDDSNSSGDLRLPSLTVKQSFSTDQSASSGSTLERTTNYKIIGRSSPAYADSDSIDHAPSSSDSNYELMGQSSSDPQSLSSSPGHRQAVLDTPGSKNYIVYGTPYASSEQASLETPGSKNFVVHNPSPSRWGRPFARTHRSQSSGDSFRPSVRGQYSQESLLIPPLRPHKRSSSENLYLHRGSRESLHGHGRANSYSSISSIMTQDTGPNVVRLAHTPSASSLRQGPWPGLNRGGSQTARMDAHQWSSHLSTVMSEYEGSEGGSRLTSLGSTGDRLSGGVTSRNSNMMRSISASLLDNADLVQTTSHTHSRSGSLDRPGTAVVRGPRELPIPPVRTVRDHDEHGDGLADLNQMHILQSKSSRSRLGFLSRQSSDRSLRSTCSSMTGSFTASSLPAWARFYYGSGENRWFSSPSIISEVDDNPPLGSHMPSHPLSRELSAQDVIQNPRVRPREGRTEQPQPSQETQQAASETSQGGVGSVRRPRKMTSSVWSPHLRLDNRASRYSLWEPPSVTWSAESSVFGRRNIQVVLFVLGFIAPFAWMIAAFLPLPPNPLGEIRDVEKGNSQAQLRGDSEQGFYRQVAPTDDSHYLSARWWRSVNRLMSLIGVLILGAVIALVVVGVKRGWGR